LQTLLEVNKQREPRILSETAFFSGCSVYFIGIIPSLTSAIVGAVVADETLAASIGAIIGGIIYYVLGPEGFVPSNRDGWKPRKWMVHSATALCCAAAGALSAWLSVLIVKGNTRHWSIGIIVAVACGATAGSWVAFYLGWLFGLLFQWLFFLFPERRDKRISDKVQEANTSRISEVAPAEERLSPDVPLDDLDTVSSDQGFCSEFSAAEAVACRRLIPLALAEDLGSEGDLTSQAIISRETQGRAALVARATGVIAGLPAVRLVVAAVDHRISVRELFLGEEGIPLSTEVPRLRFQQLVADGVKVQPGTQLGFITGPMHFLLRSERTALNFLQRLSGIATMTRRYVDAVAGSPTKILDTRKTTPGWRLLEKYAVRCGGGHNHRLGLYDGILIKDNHLAALRASGFPRAAVTAALMMAERLAGDSLPIEIEVDTLEQFDEALASRPTIILLDNMDLDTLREAVRRRNAVAPQVLLEASGGITLESIRAIAETGVDRISVGALTHSAPALDIALDYLPT
jgi:nicotinate-nucleotide pyrophosphorylase (carboxylating)